MKRYKVRATEYLFLPEIEIEAESEDKAKEIYHNKWERGQLANNNGELEIMIENEQEVKDGTTVMVA